mmetsp:Transcript_112752/g.313742  ORF Transcript_112752/g.313742 Transcript_112752/m.313742 type:complete len:358 (+) Transcript_112752:82-1155(+)
MAGARAAKPKSPEMCRQVGAALAACALIPDVVGARILQESVLRLCRGSPGPLQLAAALPSFSWPLMLALLLAYCRLSGEAPPLAGPGAGRVAGAAAVLGLLDAAQRCAFAVAADGLPPWALAATQGLDVALTAALARLAAGQRSNPARLLPVAAALLLIGLLAGSGPLEEEGGGPGIAGARALPAAAGVVAALCRSLHLLAGSALLGGSGHAAGPSARELLEVATLSSLVACAAAVPVGLAFGGAAAWPAEAAPLAAAALLFAPLGELARLAVLWHVSPLAAAVLEAAVRPLALVAAAACLGAPLSWGQPLALVALLCGAALLLGQRARTEAKPSPAVGSTIVLLGRERLQHSVGKA